MVVAAAFAAASVAVGGPAGSALVALALVLPLVLVQDGWRYVFIVRRPAAALTIDLVWLCLSCLAIVLVPDGVDVGWYVVAWGIGGIAGAVLGSILGRLQLRWVHPWSYISQNRGLGFRFMGEFITSQAAFYVALLSCGWILGLSAYGAVRGAFLFIGPLQMLAAAAVMSVLPEARMVRDQPDKVMRLVAGAGALVCGATVVWTLVGVSLPDSIGEALIGATWPEAQDVILPLGVTMIGMTIVLCALVGVRALDGTKGLAARLRSIPFQLGCPIAGAFLADLTGFVVGLALGQLISAGIWCGTFARLRREINEHVPAPQAAIASR